MIKVDRNLFTLGDEMTFGALIWDLALLE
jgi:hypothetical protein